MSLEKHEKKRHSDKGFPPSQVEVPPQGRYKQANPFGVSHHYYHPAQSYTIALKDYPNGCCYDTAYQEYTIAATKMAS